MIHRRPWKGESCRFVTRLPYQAKLQALGLPTMNLFSNSILIMEKEQKYIQGAKEVQISPDELIFLFLS
jgi:hypothetical protein